MFILNKNACHEFQYNIVVSLDGNCFPATLMFTVQTKTAEMLIAY